MNSCSRRGHALLVLILSVLFAATASAQSRGGKAAPTGVADYRSRNFLVHTDLGPKEAELLLSRLETMLKLISRYWGRPCSGIIECNVVEDLNAWPPERLNQFAPAGLAQIRQRAGVCHSRTISVGDRFISKAIVYAVAKEGVPQHESVHAYCTQTFGRTGPQWYAEGMAEMGQYWVEGEKGVNAHPLAIKYLQNSPPRTLDKLIVTDEVLGGTWQDYAWWWALCHVLENSPNYSVDFRMLGNGILTGKEVSFAQVFGPRARELTFEYLFFLKHVETGYRVDLCSWDWKKRFRPLRTTGRAVSAIVLAARGWQPTSLTVDPGTRYEYKTTGKWKTAKDSESVSAAGGPDGKGRLLGILMRDYRLSRPFPLASSGTFKFGVSGDLYVRCQDDWTALADNSGRITVRIRVKEMPEED